MPDFTKISLHLLWFYIWGQLKSLNHQNLVNSPQISLSHRSNFLLYTFKALFLLIIIDRLCFLAIEATEDSRLIKMGKYAILNMA